MSRPLTMVDDAESTESGEKESSSKGKSYCVHDQDIRPDGTSHSRTATSAFSRIKLPSHNTLSRGKFMCNQSSLVSDQHHPIKKKSFSCNVLSDKLEAVRSPAKRSTGHGTFASGVPTMPYFDNIPEKTYIRSIAKDELSVGKTSQYRGPSDKRSALLAPRHESCKPFIGRRRSKSDDASQPSLFETPEIARSPMHPERTGDTGTRLVSRSSSSLSPLTGISLFTPQCEKDGQKEQHQISDETIGFRARSPDMSARPDTQGLNILVAPREAFSSEAKSDQPWMIEAVREPPPTLPWITPTFQNRDAFSLSYNTPVPSLLPRIGAIPSIPVEEGFVEFSHSGRARRLSAPASLDISPPLSSNKKRDSSI